MSTDDRLAGIARYCYPLGLLIIVTPLLEVVARLWPFQWYLIQWRFQIELSVLNAASGLLLGALVILATAWLEESESVLKLTSVLLGILGVVLVPVLLMLVLDGMQVRDIARSELRGAVRNNVILNVIRGGVAAIASLSLAIAGWRAARRLSMQFDGRSSRSTVRTAELEQNDLLIVSDDRG